MLRVVPPVLMTTAEVALEGKGILLVAGGGGGGLYRRPVSILLHADRQTDWVDCGFVRVVQRVPVGECD